MAEYLFGRRSKSIHFYLCNLVFATSLINIFINRKCNETCLMQNQNCFAQSIYIDGKWYLLAYVNGINGMYWYQRIDWCWCDVDEDYECYTKRQVNLLILNVPV